MKSVENKTDESPKQFRKPRDFCWNLALNKKGFMGGFRGNSGKFQKIYKADDPGSLLCLISLQTLSA